MYGSATKQLMVVLLQGAARRRRLLLLLPNPRPIIVVVAGGGVYNSSSSSLSSYRSFSTSPSPSSSSSQTSSNHESPNLHPQQTPILNNPSPSSSSSSSTTTTTTWSSEEGGQEAAAGGGGRQTSSSSKGGGEREGGGPTAEYQEEQSRVLSASLLHVLRLGWTESAMIAGARYAGVSPSIIGSFPRKEAALVEFFMDDCLQKLIDIIDSREDLHNLIPSERVAKLVRIRLEMQAPFISKWPQALSIQSQPLNVPTSFKQRAMLVDEIWHSAGDDATDVDWYAKRAALGAIYTATEVYMLTDSSPEFRDTWAFLDGRVKDAFDLKKSVQEAKYLAEAVGAGMGGSLQGFMDRVFKS